MSILQIISGLLSLLSFLEQGVSGKFLKESISEETQRLLNEKLPNIFSL